MTRRDILVVLAVCTWWTLEGLVTTGQLLTMQFDDGGSIGAGEALRRGLLSSWLWIPWSLLLWACVLVAPVERGRLRRSLAILASAILAIVVLRAWSIYALNPVLGWYPVLPPFREVLLTSMFNNFLLGWLNVGVWHALIYADRARQRQLQAERLEARLAESRLEALSAQLNPHFLFNALNSIAEMVHRDAAAADRMLVGLGELLRASLENRHARLVTLRDELSVLRHYLEIEKARLGERLHLDWDIAVELHDALVPPLVLQPLAENAIRHAISTRIAPGHLGVRVCMDQEWLLLQVTDDGGGTAHAGGHGIGLANIRSRLECLYGDRQRLDFVVGPDGGSAASVRVPLRHAPQAA